MATYRTPIVPPRLLGALTLLACCLSTASAQQRKYLFELGAAGSANSFDNRTDLGGAAGGLVRFGVWLPFKVSLEGEAAFSKPRAEAADVGVKVRTLSGSVLYNVPIGNVSSAYLKLGVGTTTYDGDCPSTSSAGSSVICGKSGALLLGAGARVGVAPSIMVRGEGLYNRNNSNSIGLSNYGVNLGLSLMLGSQPIPDSDRDGVLDNRDTCAGTPPGAQVDRRGCTADGDGDGIADGVDRCPGTPAGATVDLTGCPKDSDNDNILDGIDRCPDTRAGVLVDRQGCPRDSDEDGIPDGLDRCSATPTGATVDALGCPGDEDGDGALDGLDQCPRSPAGAVVDANGCAAGQQRKQPTPGPTPAPAPNPPPPPAPAPKPAPAPSTAISGAPTVLSGVSFSPGTSRLREESYIALDSVAAMLMTDTTLHVEIGAHTDNGMAPADARRLTTLQAEAVRTYLVQKGVPVQQIAAHGYGASVPLTSDTTPRGRARNRRIEIRRVESVP